MLNWFKKKKAPEFNFATIGADMHSHILPGIDDGAQHVGNSLLMARDFQSLGFKKIIATPHIMADYYRNTSSTIFQALDVLNEQLLKNEINLEVEAAAEYYLDETFQNKVSKKEVLTFGAGYLLFELSYLNAPNNLFEVISKIQDAGYKPVLAHPERYPYYHSGMENYHQIKETGCLLQLNTISLIGYYGKTCKYIAEQLVDSYLLDFLGSDMHHAKHAAALKDSLYSNYLQLLLSQPQVKNGLL